MNIAIVAVAVVAVAGMPAFSASHRIHTSIDTNTSFGDNVITHMADGGVWKTTITVVNLSTTNAAAYTLNFYAEDGAPQAFTFKGIGSASFLTGTLNPSGSVVIETQGFTTDPTTHVGWAQFDFTGTSDNISGYAVFTHQSGQEAVVPFSSDIESQQVLAYDNTGGLGTGVALVNSNFLSTLTITAIFCDENGKTIGTDVFTMNSMTHQSFILTTKWPVTANRRGTVYFKTGTDIGLAVLGLRFNPQGAFTSVHSLETFDQ